MSILPDEHNLFYFSAQEMNLCRKKDSDPPWSRTLPEALLGVGTQVLELSNSEWELLRTYTLARTGHWL